MHERSAQCPCPGHLFDGHPWQKFPCHASAAHHFAADQRASVSCRVGVQTTYLGISISDVNTQCSQFFFLNRSMKQHLRVGAQNSTVVQISLSAETSSGVALDRECSDVTVN